MSLREEIEANYRRFENDWKQSLSDSIAVTGKLDATFLESYSRLTTLQAWRAGLLDTLLPKESYWFYLEAQNDALISHIQARCGSWRSALKSLRSAIENVLFALYYMDHPVELSLWASGRFRITFSELQKYFNQHPNILNVPESITGLGLIGHEYEKLSKAVHASSRDFRMTNEGRALSLWHSDVPRVGQWSTHEKRTIQGINLLLMTMFREKLSGTQQTSIRASLALIIPQQKYPIIAQALSVRIKKSK
jgi:hypothetical protein